MSTGEVVDGWRPSAVQRRRDDWRRRRTLRSAVIAAGSTLALGTINGPGARSYLSIRGGIQVPDYLGSKSTFTLGQFGGHGGRALRAGDVLHIPALADRQAGAQLPAELTAQLTALPEPAAQAAADAEPAGRGHHALRDGPQQQRRQL